MSLDKNKKIRKIRKKLDILDDKLLNIIKIRTNLVHKILINKKTKNQIIDRKRINVILKKTGAPEYFCSESILYIKLSPSTVSIN